KDQMEHSSSISPLLMKLIIYGLQDVEKSISEEIFLDLLTNLPFKPSIILNQMNSYIELLKPILEKNITIIYKREEMVFTNIQNTFSQTCMEQDDFMKN